MANLDRSFIVRRQLVRGTVALPFFAIGGVTLAGCASTGQAEPEDEPQPTQLNGLALLPAKATPAFQGSGFGAGSTFVVPIPAGRGASGGGFGAALATGLIAGAIAYGIQVNRKKEQQALRQALAAVDFDPLTRLDQRLVSALATANLPIEAISDTELVSQLDAGLVAPLPGSCNVLFDIVVYECGYYSSIRAGGYSPMLQLSASLRLPGHAPYDTFESFDYYADWRDGGSDRRWVTTPPSTIYPTTTALAQAADKARAGLEAVVDKIAVLIAEDVHRYAFGQPRLE